MRHWPVAGGCILATLAALVLGVSAAPVEAATKTSTARKHTPVAKETAKARKATNRPDPNTLPPVEEEQQTGRQGEGETRKNSYDNGQQVVAAEPVAAATQPVAAASGQPAAPPAAAPVAAKEEPARPAPVVQEAPVEPEEVPEVPQNAASTRIGAGKATVLGIVEGLTEYLPVSSTGHLILTSYWMGLAQDTGQRGTFGGRKIESSAAVDAFEIVIQLGAILAVLGLYRKRVGQMVRGLAGRSPDGLRLALLLFVAFLPAAVIGLALHKKIEEHLFGPMPVVIAMVVGGILMIVVEHYFWTRRKDRIHAARQTRSLTPIGASRAGTTGPMVSTMSVQPAVSRFTKVDTMLFWQALVIGCAQCLAMWPGTSRSMVTILAALVVGLDMLAAAEFSFLLALPTLGAATLFSGYKHWHELMQCTGMGGLLVGLIVSGIVAALAVKWFVGFLTRRGLMPFGVYRIVFGLILMLYFLR